MKCPPCNGTGKFGGSKCPRCNGRGLLTNDRINNPPCSYCSGTGLNPVQNLSTLGSVCDVCDGWGRLDHDPEQNGASEGKSDGPNVLYVESNKPHSAHLDLSDVLSNLKGDVVIFDPYYGSKTLLNLKSLQHCKSVRFLTSKKGGGESSTLHTEIKTFIQEHSNFEFKKANIKDLHDRYIVTDDELIILGHGLKDLGNKESFLIKIPSDTAKDIIAQIKKNFEVRWNQASAIS